VFDFLVHGVASIFAGIDAEFLVNEEAADGVKSGGIKHQS
jgi:hypothetical protein